MSEFYDWTEMSDLTDWLQALAPYFVLIATLIFSDRRADKDRESQQQMHKQSLQLQARTKRYDDLRDAAIEAIRQGRKEIEGIRLFWEENGHPPGDRHDEHDFPAWTRALTNLEIVSDNSTGYRASQLDTIIKDAFYGTSNELPSFESAQAALMLDVKQKLSEESLTSSGGPS